MNFLVKHNYQSIQELEARYLKHDIPQISVGDTVQVSLLIQEGNKERIQISQGVIISVKNASLRTTITVRKTIEGIGVEKVYLIHSPKIVDMKILKKSKVRRSKLFYLRQRHGKAARLKQKLT